MRHRVKAEPPAKQFERYRTFMLTHEMDAELIAIAAANSCSVAEVIRMYVDWGLESGGLSKG